MSAGYSSRRRRGIPLQHKTLAEVERVRSPDQFCPLCGKLITPATVAAVRWPKRKAVVEADFRPHEMIFARRTSDQPTGSGKIQRG